MTLGQAQKRLGILCVDDNAAVALALQTKLSRAGGFEWRGAVSRADDLMDAAARSEPALVLLDVDMPGRDPLTVLAEFSRRFPEIRTVIFSGHVRRDLVERAVEAGAWGYVSKNDGEEELVAALRRVADGEFALSSEANLVYGS
jgi:two-component system, NarL family, response regulator DesR